MKKIAVLAAALGVGLASPAMAQDAGDVQIKGFITGVLPDGEITEVETDLIGLPVGSQTRATNAYVPTVAVEYFVSPNFSLETICCVTPHDVRGAGALAGAELIDDAIILPATITAKYHFQLGGGIKPYIGAGPTYFLIFSEDVGADAAALGATDVDLSDEFGFVLQAGVDVPLNDRGLGLSLDAKRYFVGTTATFSAGDTVALQTEHDLDPWVVSAGLSLRF
ncbi:OmpW family outer membrane protein [Qipengyuania sp. XHP0207]|uniref:OmpW/AlkL family protein n=1 Tax=Qipengyuania sp. XHP0207 TaxID=3038078 RepID=UPI00241CF22C|nr:OmpW family outer membrane protein [Qipengyuania sp. XHP0207]MDG5747994.1 OmpW family outer membrane protein [Qipengyuania sp. XHP0207]